jgi:hypothetical protein
MSEPLFSAASTITTPRQSPDKMRLRVRKFSASGCVPRGSSEISGAFLDDLGRQLSVLRRVNHVDSAPHDGDRRPSRVERAAMSPAVDTAREPAHHGEILGGQLPCQAAAPSGGRLRSQRVRRRSRCSSTSLSGAVPCTNRYESGSAIWQRLAGCSGSLHLTRCAPIRGSSPNSFSAESKSLKIDEVLCSRSRDSQSHNLRDGGGEDFVGRCELLEQ